MREAQIGQPSLPPFNLGAKLAVINSGPLSSIAIVGITPVLPQIAEALEPGPGTMLTKQLVGIVGLAMAVGSPLAGFLISRMSARNFMFGCAALYALAGTAGLYISSLEVLIASRFLVGLAAAGFVIMAISLINIRLEGTERAKWMGIQVALAMVSSLLINPISGGLGEFGWRLPFVLFFLGIPLAVVALVLLDRQRPVATPPPPGSRSSAIWSWYPWRFAALAVCIGSITYLPVVYGPFVMHKMGATSPAVIGLVLTVDSLLGSLVALLYGKSRRWLTAGSTFMASFAFTGLGTLIAGIAPSLPLLIAGMLVSGIGMGWLIPNLVTALASEVSPAHQAKAAGITKSFHYFASPACILVVEPVATRLGPQSALVIAALLSALLFLFFAGQKLGSPGRTSRPPTV